MNGLFEASINVAIVLEKSHQFDEDPAFGELLKRMWKGDMTREDVDSINTQVVGGNGVTIMNQSKVFTPSFKRVCE